MGLGAAGGPFAVSLASARQGAQDARALIAQGRCPLAEKRAAALPQAPAKPVVTFGQCAEEFIAMRESTWKNSKHAEQWKMTLRVYAKPLWDKPVADVSTPDVLAVLKPHWTERPETASRLRNRIELVLDAATAQGLREGPNPARWRGHLKSILPARSKHTRGHFAALDWRDVPAFMQRLRAEGGTAARALELVVLTACRTSEVTGARWSEINMAEAMWVIPPERMKAGTQHRVPLSPQALSVLREMEKARRSDLVFSFSGKHPLSNMSMLQVLRGMGEKATTHGFRASFRTWAGEASNAPRDIVEACLAHTIENAAERAYVRGDLFAKRATLMAAWAAYVDAPAATVVPLHAAAASA
jgi:integrase